MAARFAPLARVLLLTAVMHLCACPIPDTTPLVNNPPYLIRENLLPPPNLVHELVCEEGDTTTALDFVVENAVEDQDVNDDKTSMFYAWYISTPTDGGFGETLFSTEFPFESVSCADVLVQGTTLLTVYVLDRFPASRLADKARIPGEGGFVVSATWVIEVVR